MASCSRGGLDVIVGFSGFVECEGGFPGWEAPGPGGVLPSDLAVGCPTGRAVYLRRRAGLAWSTGRMREGSRAHEVVLGVWRAAVEGGVEGLAGVLAGALDGAGEFRAGVLWAASAAYRWLSAGRVPPVAVEPWLPGWAGFSGGRPDLLLGMVPVELASSPAGGGYWNRKRVALAAYGLMVEAAFGVRVPFGYLVSLRDGFVEKVCLDDVLRSEALREAERLEAALEEDPGVPADPGACPASCPFRSVCWGGGVAGGRGEAGVAAEA